MDREWKRIPIRRRGALILLFTREVVFATVGLQHDLYSGTGREPRLGMIAYILHSHSAFFFFLIHYTEPLNQKQPRLIFAATFGESRSACRKGT